MLLVQCVLLKLVFPVLKSKRGSLVHWSSTMADEQQQFFLKWNDFQSNMVSSFKHLRDEKSFTDVTLACDGQTCKAHKMVLSACSPYFKSLLEVCCHPVMRNVIFGRYDASVNFLKFFVGKSVQTSHYNSKRCCIQPSSSYFGVYVCRRS